jgi:hypothetical protein
MPHTHVFNASGSDSQNTIRTYRKHVSGQILMHLIYQGVSIIRRLQYAFFLVIIDDIINVVGETPTGHCRQRAQAYQHVAATPIIQK